MLNDKVEGDSFLLISFSETIPPAGKSLLTVAAGLIEFVGFAERFDEGILS